MNRLIGRRWCHMTQGSLGIASRDASTQKWGLQRASASVVHQLNVAWRWTADRLEPNEEVRRVLFNMENIWHAVHSQYFRESSSVCRMTFSPIRARKNPKHSTSHLAWQVSGTVRYKCRNWILKSSGQPQDTMLWELNYLKTWHTNFWQCDGDLMDPSRSAKCHKCKPVKKLFASQ